MGAKSKGNYNINLCLRFDCSHRGIMCDKCVKFDYYLTSKIADEGSKEKMEEKSED